MWALLRNQMPKPCWLKVPAVYFNMGKAFWSFVLRFMMLLVAEVWAIFLEAYFSTKTHIIIYLVDNVASPVSCIQRGNKWLCRALVMMGYCSFTSQQTSPSPSLACLRNFFPTLMPLFSDFVFHSGGLGSPMGLTRLLGVSWEARVLDLPRASGSLWSLPIISCMAFTLQMSLGAFSSVPAVGSGYWFLQARSTMVHLNDGRDPRHTSTSTAR